MTRTFHSSLPPLSLLPPVLAAALSLWMLWTPSGARIVAGLAMAVVTVVMTERTIHTEYILDDKRQLVISQGRLTRPIVIALSDITAIERHPARLLQPAYVLITYGADQHVAVRPANSDAFVAELNKRCK